MENNVVSLINSVDGLVHMTPASEKEILIAEQSLGTTFADEYRLYLMAFGAASFDGHELTGLCKSERLNVVSVTEKLREQEKKECCHLYVIEELHIDGLTIWQSKTGEVYAGKFNETPVQIAESLAEYLSRKEL